MSVILNPIVQFFDLDGSPLDQGYLYFGTSNGNPETSTVQVYSDAAFTQPVAQPIRTINGYPVKAGATGAPLQIYAVGDVSMQVRNKNLLSVFYSQSLFSATSNTILRTSNIQLTVGENTKTILASGTFTQTLDSAATLGAGWSLTYDNIGTGVITIDPNLAENIDGVLTKTIAAGAGLLIECDGTQFVTANASGMSATAIQLQTVTAFTTTGTSSAYVLTPSPALVALSTKARYNVTFALAPTGSPTLAVSGLAVRNIKYYDAAGVKQFITATQVPINWNSDVIDDGVDWVVKAIPPVSLTGLIASGTTVATTSGTSIDVTGIPSWVKRITMMLNAVSTNGISNLTIRIGSGVIQATGYSTNTTCQVSGAATNAVTDSTGLSYPSQAGASDIYQGHIILTLLSGTTWICSSVLSLQNAPRTMVLGSIVTLAGALDRFRLTTANGTDTFDLGSVNILYE